MKAGCNDAKRMEPFRYLFFVVSNSLSDINAGTRYPIAYVLQSDAGASAVIGSNIVLADTCSWVDGSNRMTSPLALPIGY